MRNSPEVGGDGRRSGSEGGHGQAEEEEEGEPTEASETQGPLWKRLSQNKAGGGGVWALTHHTVKNPSVT